jgi:hypothetical protein
MITLTVTPGVGEHRQVRVVLEVRVDGAVPVRQRRPQLDPVQDG